MDGYDNGDQRSPKDPDAAVTKCQTDSCYDSQSNSTSQTRQADNQDNKISGTTNRGKPTTANSQCQRPTRSMTTDQIQQLEPNDISTQVNNKQGDGWQQNESQQEQSTVNQCQQPIHDNNSDCSLT